MVLERVCWSTNEATVPHSFLRSFALSSPSKRMIDGCGLTPTESLKNPKNPQSSDRGNACLPAYQWLLGSGDMTITG